MSAFASSGPIAGSGAGAAGPPEADGSTVLISMAVFAGLVSVIRFAPIVPARKKVIPATRTAAMPLLTSIESIRQPLLASEAPTYIVGHRLSTDVAANRNIIGPKANRCRLVADKALL